jgi:hypothetical protein
MFIAPLPSYALMESVTLLHEHLSTYAKENYKRAQAVRSVEENQNRDLPNTKQNTVAYLLKARIVERGKETAIARYCPHATKRM